MPNSTKVIRSLRRTFQTLCVLLLLLTCSALSSQNDQHRIHNIVLVHGAWADGSGWRGVYDILVNHGYNVSMVQEPETNFQEDVGATKHMLSLQDGPCILVAHSYGGAVITEAGTDPTVAGLVYIAAHMPDAGENESDDGKRFPKSTGIKKTADGFTYLDAAQFHELFAADLPAEQAAFMSRSQVFNFADNFKAVITNAAWRSKPSWMLVAGSDSAALASQARGFYTLAHVATPNSWHAIVRLQDTAISSRHRNLARLDMARRYSSFAWRRVSNAKSIHRNHRR